MNVIIKGVINNFNDLFVKKPQYDLTGEYSALDVARYVLYKCTQDDSPISNLQLQKILYYLQVYFLKQKRYALFSEEIEAWQFGPVVRNVYYQYCGFGSLDIFEYDAPSTNFSEEEKEDIDRIIEEKRSRSPWELVRDTHKKGKAWDLIYRDGYGHKEIIPKDVIVNNG